jgi:hypothetical protein
MPASDELDPEISFSLCYKWFYITLFVLLHSMAEKNTCFLDTVAFLFSK